MSNRNQKSTRGMPSNAHEAEAPASDVRSVGASAKRMLQRLAGAIVPVSAKTTKQQVAEQERDERRRAAEIKQNESDNRFTSPELIGAIEDSFGPINFDPCWHPASVVRPGSYLDVRQGHNGLRDDWAGPFAFVNPPWSAADKWVKRSHELWASGKVTTILCLIPAATDTRFFHEVLSVDADVYFLQGRPRFYKEDGTSESTMHRTMLVMFGAAVEQKRRFAELVRGSWWLPSRSSPIRTIAIDTGGSCAVSFSSASCVASYPRSLIVDVVLCTPSAGRAHKEQIQL